MYDDPKSKISELERVLNSREDRVSGRERRHELHSHEVNVNQDWDKEEFKVGTEVYPAPIMKRKLSFPIKILIVSIIFFVVALLVVVYNFIGGGNVVSGDNISVTVQAPVSIAGGETLPFEIAIKNNNNVTLTGADLGVSYPLGAKEVSNTSLSAKHVQNFLGDILPGQTIKKNLSVVLFGAGNEKKDISITLEYKVAGSNSLFNKVKTFSVVISSSPVSLVVSGPTEVNTNQSVNFTVEISSNSSTVLKDLLLKADYPFGFSFVSSNPKVYSKNNFWLLGDLAPGAKRTITFFGVLSGQEGEERGFNFALGAQASTNSLVLEAPLASSFSAVTIRRPFVSADVFFNGDDRSEYVSPAGAKVDTVIKWQNNLARAVSDVSIVVKLNGNSLNKSSIQTDSGYYRSADNTITFSKLTNSDLASLDPGQSGECKFSFSSFGVNTITGSGLTNPIISFNLSVQGKQVGSNNGLDDVSFSDSRKVKITADPQLFAKALHYVGAFQNTGPLPPKTEQETTYTITWTVTNPLNNISNAQVSATLPPYIKWLNAVSPSQELVSYDAGTGLVSWNPGNILAGAGTISPAREVSFQVSFLPSVNQIGTTPNLIGDAALMAKDSFTLTSVSDSFSALNTRLSNDPYFKINADVVAQ